MYFAERELCNWALLIEACSADADPIWRPHIAESDSSQLLANMCGMPFGGLALAMRWPCVGRYIPPKFGKFRQPFRQHSGNISATFYEIGKFSNTLAIILQK